MSGKSTRFLDPPRVRTDDGAPRRVGIELEFTGLTLEQVTATVSAVAGGEAEFDSAAQSTIETGAYGAFRVELDWAWLKERAAESEIEGEGSEWVEFLRRAAELVVPVEVVCPPIELAQLGIVDDLIAALRERGARGTDDSPLAAYGVHVNAEASSLEPASVLSIVRAFGLLQWWLVDHHEVDLSRRISPYIDLYPESYVAELAECEDDSRDVLFDGYLESNATRNRALDLLPLLAEIDESRVRTRVDDPRINPRPAYHYRMPNCSIEREGWSAAHAWNPWVVVERVADARADLAALSAEFVEQRRPLLGINRARWVEYMDDWLCRRGWV